MRVAVIMGPALGSRHGTGVQVQRIFEGSGVDLWHLYWLGTAGYQSDLAESALLNTLPRLKRRRGGRVVEKVEELLGVAWWNGHQVNADKLRRLVADRGWTCDVAYVCVADDGEAAEAWSILKVLGCPYVVHLMDLCHDDGIDPATMPGYVGLLRGASSVLAIGEAMRDEVLKVRRDGVAMAGLGKELAARAQEPPGAEGPLRIVMLGGLGSPENPALEVLADGLEALRARRAGVECVYMGQHYHFLSDRLKRLITYPGRVDMKVFETMLPQFHLAYLPSPARLDCYGKYSFVSRLVDYCMAGLPLIYCIVAGSSPERTLAPLVPVGARPVHSGEEWAAAAEHFAQPANWQAASRAVRDFAEEHFTIGRLRDDVLGTLRRAAEESRGVISPP
jgi:hypothetical protein